MHTSHMSHARRRQLTAIGAVLAAVALLAACDTNARFNPNRTQFDDLRIVSVYPAVQSGGSWVKQCDAGTAEGMLLNVVMLSTQRKEGASLATTDLDNSIRPLDTIVGRTVAGPKASDIKLGPTNLSLTLDCIDPLPDATGSANCEGAQPSAPSVSDVFFTEFAKRKVAGNVMILIDQSGSILGLVDADSGQENTPGQISNLPSNLTQAASDFQHGRLAAVKELIQQFNEQDRIGVVGFGEGLGGEFLKVPCSLPEAEGLGWKEAMDLCFTASNRDVWLTGANGLDSLQSGVDGRSNLWDATIKAYNYLSERTDLTLNNPNHLIVISDGPDTCSYSEAFGACQVPCNDIDKNDVLTRIRSDQELPNAPEIHVHFLQFESRGYRGPDPRQLEIACETGGHYQFINSESIPRQNNPTFRNALSEALQNIRLSMTGYWQLAVSSSALSSNAGPPTGTPRGYTYGVSGVLELKESSQMVNQSRPFTFSGGGDAAIDDRVVLRKPCAAPTDCGADPSTETSCHVVCSTDTGMCNNADLGEDLPDTVACNGEPGSCCEGECLTAGQVCTACSN